VGRKEGAGEGARDPTGASCRGHSLSPSLPLSPTEARLSLLAAGVLWSCGGVFIKGSTASAASITFYRSLFAALVLLPWLRGRQRPRSGDWVVGAQLYAALLLCYVASTQQTTTY
jgi:drug/metabolite transporter (DMT)-like permease